MKRNKYIVAFVDGSSVTIFCATPQQAFILACAERINEGLDYNVTHVYNNKSQGFYYPLIVLR